VLTRHLHDAARGSRRVPYRIAEPDVEPGGGTSTRSRISS